MSDSTTEVVSDSTTEVVSDSTTEVVSDSTTEARDARSVGVLDSLMDNPTADADTPDPPDTTPRRRRPRKVWVWLAIAITLLAAAGVGGWLWYRHTHPTTVAETPIVMTVATTTLQTTVTAATGTLAPAVQDSLTFPASGTVTSVNVIAGENVRKGQVLATEDTTTLQATVDSAQSSVDAASTQLSSLADDSTSKDAEISSAEASLASAKAKLTASKADLAGATMTSPITGVVAQVNLTVGNSASGSGANGTSSGAAGGGGATTTTSAGIVVVSLKSWVVNTTVGAADLPNLKTGLQATMTPTGSSTLVFGTVRSIGLIASTTSTTAAFPVVIEVTGTPTGLYIGGTTTVSIMVKQIADAIAVPTLAITSADGQAQVSVLKDGVATPVNVTLGRVFGTQTQVTDGLAVGDQVVLPVGSRSTVTRGSGNASAGSFQGGPGQMPGDMGGLGGTGLGGTGLTGTGNR